MEHTIETLAAELTQALTTKRREDGEAFVTLRDESPEWMLDVCHEAHGKMLPDSHRYRMILDAAEIIADGGDSTEYQPDVYNHDLIAWLGSHSIRVAFSDEAHEQGMGNNLMEILQAGQCLEFEEVYSLLYSALEDAVDSLNSETA